MYMVADKVQLRFTIFLDLMFLNLGICIQLVAFLPTQWSWSCSRQQALRSSRHHRSPSTLRDGVAAADPSLTHRSVNFHASHGDQPRRGLRLLRLCDGGCLALPQKHHDAHRRPCLLASPSRLVRARRLPLPWPATQLRGSCFHENSTGRTNLEHKVERNTCTTCAGYKTTYNCVAHRWDGAPWVAASEKSGLEMFQWF